MSIISGISGHGQYISTLAATKAAATQVQYAQAVQAQRDEVAKSVIAPERLDETRANPNLNDTFEADDTFANVETQKIRGGRLDLVV